MSAPAYAPPLSLQRTQQPIQIPSQQQVAELAYALWEQRGSPIGSAEDDWLEAERMLLNGQTSGVQLATGN